MPTITLCMIVRDEAALLPEFLDRVRGAFDRFIAVDTGSVDATPALLAAAGAQVLIRPWRDDFAYARNEGLAVADGDWILVLDADEFVEPGFAAELRAMADDDGLGAATLCRHDEQRNGIIRVARPIRFFRRDPGIRYRCRIHEDASEGIERMLAGRRISAMVTPVRHIGYRADHIASRDKLARDERLLLLSLSDDPEDLYSRYKLLELYRYAGRPEAARPVADDCRRLLAAARPIAPPNIAGDLVEMVRAALYADDDPQGLAFLEAHAAVAGHTGHYHLALGVRLEAVGRIAEAASHFEQARQLAVGDPSRVLIETRALAALARLCLMTGDVATARRNAAAAAERTPDDPEVVMLTTFLSGCR